jgi:hypothetical protein
MHLTAADQPGIDLVDTSYDYRTRRLSNTEYDAGISFQELYTIYAEFIRGASMGGGIGSSGSGLSLVQPPTVL